ncbi:MAG: bifunctional UDP-N-acetylglucosamine diphosphorylase/glucosamine-1-phosphate N-acetyltransferase GlmU [Clostridia bacterium]
MNKVKAIILAGGKGTRMKSELPKVLHKVYDRCIIDYVCDSCKQAGVKDISIIVGHKYQQIINHIGENNAHFFIQKEQLGTGHAVMQAQAHINDDDFVIVVNGDMPLISSYTIKSFISFLQLGNFDGALASAVFDKTPNYGRIVRDKEGNFSKIVEQKDCNEEELAIEEVNIGLYCFRGKYLKDSFKKLNNNNAQKEYYITDIPYYIMDAGGRVGVYMIQNSEETQGINSRSDLSVVTKTLLCNTREKHMDNGVTLIDPDNTYISLDVEIGRDTIIYPGTNIQGKSKIGEGCIIGPNSTIVCSKIGNHVTVETSKIIDSKIDDNAKIGPFAHIRPNCNIGESSKIGSFVEIKNVNIGTNTKVPHLIYLGDSDIGNNVEVACGVITSNMNTKLEKNKTVIKDNAFIGCNSVLIAPITVEKYGVVGAGTTISSDVPSKALALTRSELKIKENYYKENKK